MRKKICLLLSCIVVFAVIINISCAIDGSSSMDSTIKTNLEAKNLSDGDETIEPVSDKEDDVKKSIPKEYYNNGDIFGANEYYESDVKDINKLKILNEVGGIEIAKKEANSDTMDIEVKTEVIGNLNESDAKNVLDKVKICIFDEDKASNILPYIDENNKKIRAKKWVDKNRNSVSSLSISYKISIPENIIKEFDINNKVGQISISDMTGKFKVINGVGRVQTNNLEIFEDSSFKTKTGGIKLNAESLKECRKLDLNTEVGSIDINISSDDKYNVIAKNMRGTTGSPTDDKEYCNIYANTNVGRVNW
jgi:hypothetical protein